MHDIDLYMIKSLLVLYKQYAHLLNPEEGYNMIFLFLFKIF